MAERKLEPGQIWTGDCLSSYEPNFQFVYVLLSAKTEKGDEEKDRLWWSAAVFTNKFYGAPVKKFTEDEIRKLSYSSHISDNCFNDNIVRRILRWLKKL